MVDDFFTKPLQGSLYKKMRDFIMGITSSINEECVVENVKSETFIENGDAKQTYADVVKSGAGKITSGAIKLPITKTYQSKMRE